MRNAILTVLCCATLAAAEARGARPSDADRIGSWARQQERAPVPETPGPEPPALTATGCVAAGPEKGSFVLTGVTWSEAPPATNAGHHESGKEPAAARGAKPARPATVRLAGAIERLKVGAHLGHTVTVTGLLSAADPIVTPAVVLPDDPRPPSSGRGHAGPQVFNARSLTMVTGACK